MTTTVQEFYQGALLADAAYISFSKEGLKLYEKSTGIIEDDERKKVSDLFFEARK